MHIVKLTTLLLILVLWLFGPWSRRNYDVNVIMLIRMRSEFSLLATINAFLSKALTDLVFIIVAEARWNNVVRLNLVFEHDRAPRAPNCSLAASSSHVIAIILVIDSS